MLDRLRIGWLPIVAVALSLLDCWIGVAHAQTTLVRACPTQPTTTGFGACVNSVWALPAPGLIVDVLQAGGLADLWESTTLLAVGDRVFACQDPAVTPGPFKTCPTLLAGQTNNYLSASSVNFLAATTVPETVTYQAVNEYTDDLPIPAGIAVTYDFEHRLCGRTVWTVLQAALPAPSAMTQADQECHEYTFVAIAAGQRSPEGPATQIDLTPSKIPKAPQPIPQPGTVNSVTP